MSASLVPATMRLCESCPTLLADGAVLQPEAAQQAVGDAAAALAVPLDDGDEGEAVAVEEGRPVVGRLDAHLSMRQHDAGQRDPDGVDDRPAWSEGPASARGVPATDGRCGRPSRDSGSGC